MIKHSKAVMIHIKVDSRIKDEAQFLAEEMGLTLNAVINATLRQLIRAQEIRFSAENKMTPYLEGVLAKAREDANRYKNKLMNLADATEYHPDIFKE